MNRDQCHGFDRPRHCDIEKECALKKTTQTQTEQLSERKTDGQLSALLFLLASHSRDFHHQQASRCGASLSRFGINIKIRCRVKLTDGPNSWREGGAA